MAAPTLTYTLTNGSTADASQVMENFNNLLSGITDGTKDLSISALTCAGTATLNGHVNLGNSSADDLTITASLASSLAVKTDSTYSIGSTSLRLARVWTDAISGTATNDSASAGDVGEYMENARTSATPAITTNTWCSIDSGNVTLNDGAETGISLTAGDWDVSASIYVITTGAVSITRFEAFIGTAKGTTTTGQDTTRNYVDYATTLTSGADVTITLPMYRVSISSTTPHYLKFRAQHSGGTSLTCQGIISARRVR